jgi:hypothetical protein
MAATMTISSLRQLEEVNMQKLWIFVVACALFGTLTARPALADNVVVGVNVMGPQAMTEQQQDALIKQLRQNGVTTIRTGISYKHPLETFTTFVAKASKSGIGTIMIVPADAGAPACTRGQRYHRTIGPCPP